MTTSTTAIQKNHNVSWGEYYQLGEQLAKKIHQSGWDFDHICAIARGGMPIGDMMSRLFKKPLAIISASSYQGHEQKSLYISAQIAMTADRLAQRVLLVDDLLQSGKTMIAVKKHIEEQYPDIEVRVAVLWNKIGSTMRPDYCADESIEKGTWIHQPCDNLSLGGELSPDPVAHGPHLHVSWDEFYRLGSCLASKIKERSLKIDVITCIARGGMFVGDMMSRMLDKPLAVIVASSYRGPEGKDKKQLRISENITSTTHVMGCVLLVDDLVESGDSLKAVKEHIKSKHPKVDSKIFTAVLW